MAFLVQGKTVKKTHKDNMGKTTPKMCFECGFPPCKRGSQKAIFILLFPGALHDALLYYNVI